MRTGPSGPASGMRQLGYSASVPGLVLGAGFPDGVHEGDAQQGGRRQGSEGVERLHRALNVAWRVGQQTPFTHQGQHGFLLGRRLRPFLLDGAQQQSQ